MQNIWHSYGRHIVIYYNYGSWKCAKEAMLPRFETVWCNGVAIAKILSFGRVKDKHDVQYYKNEYMYQSWSLGTKLFSIQAWGGIKYHNTWEWYIVLVNNFQENMEGSMQ